MYINISYELYQRSALNSNAVSCSFFFLNHCVLKMPKSEWRGECPKFIKHVKGGYVLISKSKVFFKSVERNFEQISEKFWTGFPRALPPGISIKKYEKNFY